MNKIMGFKKAIIDVMLFFLLVYTLFGLFLFFNQRSMLYYPDNQDFSQCPGFSGYELMESGRTRFYFKPGAGDRLIVYYHGNAGSACDRSSVKSFFEQSNASLIFPEYAGYSGDSVKPSRKLILVDVENIRDFIAGRSSDSVVIYGQSIGLAAASYHASLGGWII